MSASPPMTSKLAEEVDVARFEGVIDKRRQRDGTPTAI
jgi:hypothetical protein